RRPVPSAGVRDRARPADDDRRRRGEAGDMSRPRRMRTTPEWITFAVAVAVLAILVGGLVAQIVRSTDPARPVATVVDGGITERDGRFTVPVEVVNEGDHGAQAVQVGATLTAGGTT